jgi:hypothetical protein
MIGIAALALTAALAAESPLVGLAVQPAVGLTDDEVKAAHQKLSEELAGMGLTVVDADAIDSACLPDPSCVEGARTSAASPKPALVVVELVRIGPARPARRVR